MSMSMVGSSTPSDGSIKMGEEMCQTLANKMKKNNHAKDTDPQMPDELEADIEKMTFSPTFILNDPLAWVKSKKFYNTVFGLIKGKCGFHFKTPTQEKLDNCLSEKFMPFMIDVRNPRGNDVGLTPDKFVERPEDRLSCGTKKNTAWKKICKISIAGNFDQDLNPKPGGAIHTYLRLKEKDKSFNDYIAVTARDKNGTLYVHKYNWKNSKVVNPQPI